MFPYYALDEHIYEYMKKLKNAKNQTFIDEVQCRVITKRATKFFNR